jgi:hypothetical protein
MGSRHVRAYSALLRLYPRSFTATYRREMTILFAQQLQDVRSSEGTAGVLRLWLRSLADVVATAPIEHVEKDVFVPAPVARLDEPRRGRGRSSRNFATLAVLLPVWLFLALTALEPHFMDPMFQKPPEVLGLPLGTIMIGVSMIWAAIGAGLMRATTGEWTRLLIVLLFIIPAVLSVMLGPAVILIMQNLTT